MAGFRDDMRVAARSLLRTPRVVLLAVLTLGLGIGASSTIFSVVNGVLLRPLDLQDSDDLTMVLSTAPGLGYDEFPLSQDVYVFYREESSAFEDLAIYQSGDANLTGEGDPERVRVAVATHSLWSTLRESPVMGRTWSVEEDLPDAGDVAVISHELWQRRFGGSRDVLGRTVEVDGRPRQIIGVMREGMRFPANAEIWIPLGMDPENPAMGNFAWFGVGRLAQGVAAEEAQVQLQPLITRIMENQTDEGSYRAFLEEGRYAPVVETLKENVLGDLKGPLWILLGTVGVVLLIACANVANLLLVRAESRQRELAVRSALGASRAVLSRGFLAESLVLGLSGGALGLFLTWVGVPLLVRTAPPQIPRLSEIGTDVRVVAFTAAVALVSALLFGVAPILRYTGTSLLPALGQGGRGNTGGRERHRVRNALVVAQTGLALVLLVGSGLLVRSFWEIRRADPGFVAEDVLTFRLSLPASRYDSPESVIAFQEQLKERLLALPGVANAGVTSNLPLSGASGTAYAVEDRPTEEGRLPPMLHYNYVGDGYLESMGVTLKEGRTIRASDIQERRPVVVVSDVIADQFWPGESALGRRIRFAGDTTGVWMEIVGVTGAVRQNGIRAPAPALLYHPSVSPGFAEEGRNWILRDMSWAMKGSNLRALSGPVREAVWSLDPTLPVADMRTMDSILSDSLVQMSFTMMTLALSAVMALLLGAVGLYGVLSYVVTQRTQEIGVRMALGAEQKDVVAMVMGQGVRIAAVGLVLGLVGAMALTRLLQNLLYETPALDPLTFGATAAVLAVVAVAASYLPARRAAGVDPVEAMKPD